jgi:glycerol-1-phosphate dehydrogenase [NAD(P)+]
VSHGEQVGLGAAFATFLRGDRQQAVQLVAFLRRHGLPAVPADMGLDAEQFTRAVLHAPSTRPGRYTILEHLDLGGAEIREALREYTSAVGA